MQANTRYRRGPSAALRLAASIVLAVLLPLAACRSSTAHSSTSSTAETTSGTATAKSPTANRDKHGDPDVEKYISRLQSKERVEDLQVDTVVKKLTLPEDAVIGDLGCGPGVFTLAFAKAAPRGVIYASDIEPAQIDRVREKIEKKDVRNVVPVLASYGDPHFPLARLDYVFIADTYHHLDDRVAYMKRLKETLKPGGRLVILEYKPGKLPVGPPPDHKLPAGVMKKELIEAGFTLVDRYDTHEYHDFEVWRAVQPWEQKK